MKSSFKALSFCEEIKEGRYFLHSSFSKAENYFNGKKLVSLVLKEVSDGPGNIVVSSLPKAQEIKISKKFIFIDSKPYLLPKKKYSPKLGFAFSLEKEKLEKLKKKLLEKAPALSMAFVFEKKRELFFSSPFLKKMLSSMKKGISLLRKGNFPGAAKAICGLGIGLTPSGDDFLSGFILALKLSGENEKAKSVFLSAKSENLISLKALRNSYLGFCQANMKDLLLDLSQNKSYLKSFEKVLACGSTSGADFLAGFLFAQVLLRKDRK